MSVLVIPEHDVRRLLPMDECIEAMDGVLRSLARGELHQPLRFVTRPPGAESLMGFMPAHRSGAASRGEKPAGSRYTHSARAVIVSA